MFGRGPWVSSREGQNLLRVAMRSPGTVWRAEGGGAHVGTRRTVGAHLLTSGEKEQLEMGGCGRIWEVETTESVPESWYLTFQIFSLKYKVRACGLAGIPPLIVGRVLASPSLACHLIY